MSDTQKVQPSRLADKPADYQRLGLTHEVQPWEDAMRTTGGKGSFEWWYFDSHLDDGTVMVIVFLTKGMMAVNGSFAPIVQIDVDFPDGRKVARTFTAKGGDVAGFSTAKDHCDIRVGANRFHGDLTKYQIHVDIEGLVVDVELDPRAPAWRPETGFMYYGEHDERQFSWLPTVPEGAVTTTIAEGGRTHRLSGTGYHDHNWGDTAMTKLIHHWYWGRGKIGDYTVVSANLTGTEEYGYRGIQHLLIAKHGQVVADNGTGPIAFHADATSFDAASGKPVEDDLVYEIDGRDGARYRVTYHREQTILREALADRSPAFQRFLAKLVGFDGAYLRFGGTITVERIVDGQVVESSTNDQAVWELMYFGKAPKNAA
jgi:hypothetical protein